MNIIVPINIAALRVSPSSQEQAKTALYDFSLLGTSPASALGGLIAANQFMTAETAMNIEPGIHIHWSLPKVYTHGVQDQQTGAVNFPMMPNRWLVIRFLKDSAQNTSIRLWVLESDAHSADSSQVGNSTSTIPWMDDVTKIQGLQYHYIGNAIDLTSTWTEPAGNNFLGTSFQAPFGYGETFTAYYQNSSNVLGLYDNLSDRYPNANQLELNCQFSASYVVMGWVNNTSLDECNITLNNALAQYNNLPEPKPDFSSYIQNAIEQTLEWSLPDYSVLTPTNAGQVQAVMSGILASVTWNITSPGNPYYPDSLPSGTGVDVSVGNNTPEALSAYINKIETTKITGLGEDITSNVEMLLNALQFNQLQKLSSGDVGVGQLQEFLHGTSFAAGDGGFVWSVRLQMNPLNTNDSGADNEVALPVYLARILSELNKAQKGLDAARNDIASKMRQAFFDWSYYIKSINDNVVNGKGKLNSDISGPFLADGMIQLYPLLLKAGSYKDTSAPSAPYNPVPDTFSILAPFANLSSYQFNTSNNTVAATFIQNMLGLATGLDEVGDQQLPDAANGISLVISLLVRYLQGGADAQDYLTQATQALSNVLSSLNTVSQAMSAAATGIAAAQTSVSQAMTVIAGYLDSTNGVFAKSLVFKSTQSVPVPAGTTYTGTIPIGTLKNLGAWDKQTGPFPGMKPQMDIFAGQGSNSPNLFDTAGAAVYLGAAYFYYMSGLTPASVCAYYLQMAQQEIINSQTSATGANTALNASDAALSSATVTGFNNSLSQIINTIIPGIEANISNTPTPDTVKAALTALISLLDTSAAAVSIPALRQAILTSDWQALRGGLDTTIAAVADCLPWSQQVAMWNQFLYGQISDTYQLDSAPADPFFSPNDPVVLFAEQGSGGDLLKPVDRNGKANTLPCRTDGQIVTATGSVTIPPVISGLSTNVIPQITGMSATLQALGVEGFLLTPEFAPVVSADALATASAQNETAQEGVLNNIVLNDPPTGLSGMLPYYIAYSWRDNADGFLPLFIWWESEVQYSQTYQNNKETYPANYLSLFDLGQYEVDLEPTEAAMPNFARNEQTPNFFSTHGLISLSSSSTSNLCDQIKIYCTTYLNYDPSQGPPPTTLPNYDEALKFYNAYTDYQTRNVLSQGLSGFSESMVQRAQELQIPINIPQSWTSTSGSGIDMTSLWPTAFLHAQSQDWPVGWNAEGINFDAFSNSQTKVFFTALRAGFLQLKTVVLVDVFGRFVPLTIPQPLITADSMTADQPAPANHEIYLAPRLSQPTRLNFNWLSATSASGIGSFTELNHNPAASPICGWLFPNHLDGTLMLYDANGVPLGSLGARGTQLHWFPVPGETTIPGVNNRDQMTTYFASKNANEVFQDFIEQFLYVDDTPASESRLEKFLSVISLAQQFIITAEMQESADLAVLIGSPLVITRAVIELEQKGLPYVGLDLNTYPVWNQPGPQFNLTSSAFIPYNLDNLNQGNIGNITVPVKIGTAEINASGTPIPYFDDGLAGYFISGDYSTMYTPVNTTDDNGVVSTAYPASLPVSLTPGGASITLTMISDPRAAVHATTGILPVGAISIPSNQFAQTVDKLEVSFLAAPILAASNPPQMPLPAEDGFQWYWQQIGMPDQGPLKTDQKSANAVFPNSPQQLIDGWLKLKK